MSAVFAPAVACRPLRGGASVAVLAALAAGCGGTDAVKPSPLPEFKPTADARVAWRASVGSSKRVRVFPGAARRRGLCRRLRRHASRAWMRPTASRSGEWTPSLKLSGGVGADDGPRAGGQRQGCGARLQPGGQGAVAKPGDQRGAERAAHARQPGGRALRRRPHLRARCRQRRAQVGVSGHAFRRCCCAPTPA